MTLSEFRAMMNALIDERLSEWVDTDAGLELRPEVVERIKRLRTEYAAGKRGKSLGEIANKYGVKLKLISTVLISPLMPSASLITSTKKPPAGSKICGR